MTNSPCPHCHSKMRVTRRIPFATGPLKIVTECTGPRHHVVVHNVDPRQAGEVDEHAPDDLPLSSEVHA